MRQVVDWRATFIAAMVGGLAFLITIAIVLPTTTGGTLWAFFRYVASIVMGSDVLPPPASFDAGVVVVGLLVHFLLSLIFGAVLATIIHRWGLLVGLIGGALFGLAIYAINFFTFTLFFDWFYLLRSWPILLAHVLFGAVTGFVYELLEVERFVPDEP
jgi:hypothetical protein